jgi:filamentous hemagglutinin
MGYVNNMGVINETGTANQDNGSNTADNNNTNPDSDTTANNSGNTTVKPNGNLNNGKCRGKRRYSLSGDLYYGYPIQGIVYYPGGYSIYTRNRLK